SFVLRSRQSDEDECTHQTCRETCTEHEVGEYQTLCGRQSREEDRGKSGGRSESVDEEIVELHQHSGRRGKSKNHRRAGIDRWFRMLHCGHVYCWLPAG